MPLEQNVSKRQKKCGRGSKKFLSRFDADDCGIAIDFMLRRGISLADIRARFAKPVDGARRRKATQPPAPA